MTRSTSHRRWALALGAALGLVLAPVTGVPAQAAVADPASLVNTFLGTSNGGNDFPGADVPFGMVQWSPDTASRAQGGGYTYSSPTITGFSLTHIAGPGCGAYGDVPIMPTTGAIGTNPGGASAGYAHSGESATPGYYSVNLNNGVRTELTTTTRGGIGRFTFPSTTQANLLFKLTGSQNGVFANSWQAVSDTEVAGSVTSGHFCGATNTYTVYFSVAFDHTFSTGTWLASQVQAGRTRASATSETAMKTADTAKPEPKYHGAPPPGQEAVAALADPNGGYLTFDTTANQVVQARIGVSFTSQANAQANRDAEVPNFGFDAVRTAAHNSWNTYLSRIQTTGGTTAQQHVFYSSLYHALLHPNVFSDANGQYRGFDGAVHSVAAGHAHYANYSGWDIYRSQAQLLGMIAPGPASDIAQSMVDVYTAGGRLPKWAQANGESYVMVGDPADPIIAGIYAFGGRNFNTTAAKNAMIQEATVANQNRPGLNYLTSLGYLPSDGSYGCCNFYGSVSTTLEYNTADFAIGAFAGALGDTANQATFVNRAQSWRTLLNPSSGFMQPRLAGGGWTSGFSPTSGSNMVEGTSWQYTGMVPFNVRGLADAKGGNAAMITYLDHVLGAFNGSGGDHADLGNEPSIELPWEYDYVGQPWKAQAIIRNVQNQLWPDSPGGWGVGNDDLGTMSAWYVWSAMGMFPETPGTADLALATPLFDQVDITLSTGNHLVVNAPQAGTYIQGASWNGASWNNAYLPPSAVMNGGTLNLTLGGTANTSWATAASSAPPSYPGTGTPPPTGTNLALNKTATGTTPCGASEGPEKAVNGSVSGGNGDKWCSLVSPKWLQVDLGGAQSVNHLTVRHASAGGESASFNTRDFNLQVSTDASAWTTVATVTGNTAGVTDHAFTATSARYVRLNVTTPAQTTDAAARIYELEVYGPPPGGTNLALNRTATGTTPCGASEGPEKAVNGSVSGGNSDKWCSLVSPKWLQVDLGSARNVSTFTVRHASAGGESATFNTRDFNLQVSTDGSAWTTVATVTGNTAGVTTHPIATTSARYVRLNVTTPAQTTDAAARIYELEVYGP
ncbi:lectin [Sphaerisporangium corydalis]|uniref:Lectin n=1 Tax=Sphaerisporangium corydalis TaxID=1441875 RepID=A0ABV9EEV1_9ACTN|nr:lectin [Sphaerisporangium corydalis]